MLRGFGFGVVVPSGAEWYVLVPKMCPYCVRPESRLSENLRHPDECPELVGVQPYLIHPPGKLSATAS
jgi:hypothetical protein